jgi:hypothetical protein
MAKAETPPEEPEEPEQQPPPGDEDEAWGRATPRLKALFRETLDEYFAEGEKENEPDPEEPKRPAAVGRVAAAAGRTGGRSTGLSPAKARTRQTPGPSGGSILDIFLGR